MTVKSTALSFVMTALISLTAVAQTPTDGQSPNYVGTVTSMEYVPSMASRMAELQPVDDAYRQARDRRSLGNKVVIGKDRQTENDPLSSYPHPDKASQRVMPPIISWDAYQSNSSPTDPSVAIGPNHVFVVFNTGFVIYDKSGNVLLGPAAPNPAIFPSGGCCDLTVSYDSAAQRWVVSFLGAGAQIAVSDGPDPVTSGWFVYTIGAINDYQKLSVWSDGYYMTDNTGGPNKVWALERDEMLAGNPSAQIIGFNLPGISTSGFYSPQAFNVSSSNMPAAGAAPIVYLQDDAWGGVTEDHIKMWLVDVDWANPGNSTISAPTEFVTTPYISVFDGGSFSNLSQPGGGADIDALQATIMNQAQFRKFPTHNSAVFNFVIDSDAGSGELAAIRWYEFRQAADGQPWSIFQEGTYTAPDGRHAWHGSLIMDGDGNIGMGYTSMAGPDTPNPNDFRVSSYYTGRFDGDAPGVMTVVEELISAGNQNIPNFRYGDYSKIDIDPSDDTTFWFINEYMAGGTRAGVVGAFQLTPPQPNDIGVLSIDQPVNGPLTANEDIVVTIRNFGSDDITDPEVQYTVDGGTPVVETYSGTITAGTSVQYTFSQTADLSVPGTTYLIEAQTNLPADSNPNNDTASKSVLNGLIYCQPTADCSFGDGFQLFSVQEIDNASGCEGYGDFTNLVANFQEDTTYDLTVTTGYGDQFITVWIDFNDDGNFSTDEVVVDNYEIASGQAQGTYTETMDLVIPAGVAPGEHRMRAKTNWDAPVPSNACEATDFGETEDYTASLGDLGITDLELAGSELMVISKPNKQYEVILVTPFDGTASIRILNTLGQTVAFNNLEKEGDRFTYDLDMSYAASGVYLIQMGDQGSNSYKTAKIIVR